MTLPVQQQQQQQQQQQVHYKLNSLSPSSSSSSSISPSTCMLSSTATYNFNLIDYNNEKFIQTYYNNNNHNYEHAHHQNNNNSNQDPSQMSSGHGDVLIKRDGYMKRTAHHNRMHPYNTSSFYHEDNMNQQSMPMSSYNQQYQAYDVNQSTSPFYAHSNIYYHHHNQQQQQQQQSPQLTSIDYTTLEQSNSFYQTANPQSNHTDYPQSYDLQGHRSRSTVTKTTVNTKHSSISSKSEQQPKCHKRSHGSKRAPISDNSRNKNKAETTQKTEKRPHQDDGSTTSTTPPPKKRFTANKKERRRTQSINNAFTDLRNSIPHVPVDTKLSKIKTLKLAAKYIEYLMDVLEQNDPVLLSNGFKPDLGKLRRECRSRDIKVCAYIFLVAHLPDRSMIV